MVLALILQSALTLKLVLCDHDSFFTTYNHSNQTDDSDSPPPGQIAFTVLVIVGYLICYGMHENGIGCFRKSEEQRNEREEVSQLLLNSNLN